MKPQKRLISLAVATALTGFGLQVQAGTATITKATYAVEAAVAGKLDTGSSPQTTYTPGQFVAAGGAFTVYVRLNGGAEFASTATGITASYPNPGGGTVNSNTTTMSSDKMVLAFSFEAIAAALQTATVITIPASANPDAVQLSGATGLATSGGTVTADYALADGAVSPTVVFPTAARDTVSGKTFADSADATTVTITASTTEKSKVDVFATPPRTAINAGTGAGDPTINVDEVNFGSLVLANAAGTQLGATADYTLAADTKVNLTVTGKFVEAATMTLETNPNCTAAGTVASTLSASADTFTFAAIAPGAAATYYVCYKTGAVAATTEIPVTTPAMAVQVVDNGTTNVLVRSASGNLFPLVLNGPSVDLLNYVPSTLAPYVTYVRVLNDGTVAGDVSVTIYDSATGTALGNGVVKSSLGAGQAVTLSAAQIEAAAGVTLGANVRPWIRVSAGTDSIIVQTYLGDPNGGFTNMTDDKK